jgi:hypothetical protein
VAVTKVLESLRMTTGRAVVIARVPVPGVRKVLGIALRHENLSHVLRFQVTTMEAAQ